MDEAVYRGTKFRRADVLRALETFDREHRDTFPASRYKTYAIRHDGKWYPPKEVLRFAIRCQERDFVRGGGPNINRPFEQLGFEIVADWGNAPAPVVSTLPSHPAENISAAEGRELLRQHRRLERKRNKGLVIRKKRSVLSEFGRLACEACGFDFAETYGPRGVGFAECHHTLPISQSVEGRRTHLSELAVVCANCHRMLHRRPWVSVPELKKLLYSQRSV